MAPKTVSHVLSEEFFASIPAYKDPVLARKRNYPRFDSKGKPSYKKSVSFAEDFDENFKKDFDDNFKEAILTSPAPNPEDIKIYVGGNVPLKFIQTLIEYNDQKGVVVLDSGGSSIEKDDRIPIPEMGCGSFLPVRQYLFGSTELQVLVRHGNSKKVLKSEWTPEYVESLSVSQKQKELTIPISNFDLEHWHSLGFNSKEEYEQLLDEPISTAFDVTHVAKLKGGTRFLFEANEAGKVTKISHKTTKIADAQEPIEMVSLAFQELRNWAKNIDYKLLHSDKEEGQNLRKKITDSKSQKFESLFHIFDKSESDILIFPPVGQGVFVGGDTMNQGIKNKGIINAFYKEGFKKMIKLVLESEGKAFQKKIILSGMNYAHYEKALEELKLTEEQSNKLKNVFLNCDEHRKKTPCDVALLVDRLSREGQKCMIVQAGDDHNIFTNNQEYSKIAKRRGAPYGKGQCWQVHICQGEETMVTSIMEEFFGMMFSGFVSSDPSRQRKKEPSLYQSIEELKVSPVIPPERRKELLNDALYCYRLSYEEQETFNKKFGLDLPLGEGESYTQYLGRKLSSASESDWNEYQAALKAAKKPEYIKGHRGIHSGIHGRNTAYYAKICLALYRKYSQQLPKKIQEELDAFDSQKELEMEFLCTIHDVARTHGKSDQEEHRNAFYAALVLMKNYDYSQEEAIKLSVELANKGGELNENKSLMSRLIESADCVAITRFHRYPEKGTWLPFDFARLNMFQDLKNIPGAQEDCEKLIAAVSTFEFKTKLHLKDLEFQAGPSQEFDSFMQNKAAQKLQESLKTVFPDGLVPSFLSPPLEAAAKVMTLEDNQKFVVESLGHEKLIIRPSSSLESATVVKLSLRSNKPVIETKDRGDKFRLLEEAYQEGEELTNILAKIILEAANDNSLSKDQALIVLQHAKSNCGLRKSIDSLDSGIDKKVALKFSALVQRSCEQCGIYSGRTEKLRSDKLVGLRTAFIPDDVITLLERGDDLAEVDLGNTRQMVSGILQQKCSRGM